MSAASRARGRGAGPRARFAPVVGLCLGALACLALAEPAHAYVRYRTEMGTGFFWPQTWVPVTVYPLSMTDVNGGMDMTTDQIVTAATTAANAWSASDNACTYLQVKLTQSDGDAPAARYDAKNSLVFRTTTWCPTVDAQTGCYDPSALAITSVFVNKKDGRIRDADIEVNAKHFVWADLDLDPSVQNKQDLQNALTHEFGHLIGLDHTCFPTGTAGEAPLDNEGQPAPNCDAAPEAVRETTMFASALPGDKEKRTLAPDDIRAICEIYPLADDPKIYVTGDDPAGCTCALGARGGRGGALAVSAAGVLAALVMRRRSRTR
jgi:hypothetical protein